MKFTSAKRPFNGDDKIIALGLSAVVISAISETLAKKSDQWNDQTPQLEVTFEDEEGKSLKHWFNLQGYQTKADFEGKVVPKNIEFRSSEKGNEEYAVDTTTGNRLVSESKTAECEAIIGYFVGDTGVDIGEETDANSLMGSAVGIMVRENSRGFREMHYSLPADQVEARKAKLAEKA
jgi:hypothetical protein